MYIFPLRWDGLVFGLKMKMYSQYRNIFLSAASRPFYILPCGVWVDTQLLSLLLMAPGPGILTLTRDPFLSELFH